MGKGGGNAGGGAKRGPGRGRSTGPTYRRPGGGGGGTGGNTGGTRHKSSSVEGSPIIKLVWGIVFGVGAVVSFVGYGLLHGYGVI